MKVQINIVPKNRDEEIVLNVHSMNAHLTEAVELMTKGQKNSTYLMGKVEDGFYKVDYKTILYIEVVDRKQFVYTDEQVFEVQEKLYELEKKLLSNFVRISKSMILNLDKIQSFHPKLSGNMEAVLTNEEKVSISRRYVQGVKIKLGMEAI